MTQPHLTQQNLDQYRAGTFASVDALLGVEAHLSACDACRTRLQAMTGGAGASLYALLHTDAAPLPCPDRALLNRYASGQADALDREFVETHLEGCASCSAALALLDARQPTPPTRQPASTALAAGRAPASQQSSVWQRLFSPRLLAPAFAASTLLASLSLKMVYSARQENMALASVQQENMSLTQQLTQERYQNIALSKQRDGGIADATKSDHSVDIPVPAYHDGDSKTGLQSPPIPTRPDQSIVDKPQPDKQLAEARKQVQAEQARNAQTAQRLEQREARLKQGEELLKEKILAASRKQDDAPEVRSNGSRNARMVSTPPDTRQGKMSPPARSIDINAAIEQTLAKAAPSSEVKDLLIPEAGSTRSDSYTSLRPVELVSPNPQGSMILDPLPVLRWRPVEGAAFYKIHISEVYHSEDGGVGYKELEWIEAAKSITGTQYQVEHALTPGKVYSWQVSAYRNAQDKPFARASARFLVADAAQEKALRQLAQLQFAAGKSLEAQQEWERAQSQYRAISSSVSDVYDQAQARIAELEKRRKPKS